MISIFVPMIDMKIAIAANPNLECFFRQQMITIYIVLKETFMLGDQISDKQAARSSKNRYFFWKSLKKTILDAAEKIFRKLRVFICKKTSGNFIHNCILFYLKQILYV